MHDNMLHVFLVCLALLVYVVIGMCLQAWSERKGLEHTSSEGLMVCTFWPLFVVISLVGGLYYTIKRTINGG